MRRAAVLVLLALTGPVAAQPRRPITANGTEAFRAVVASYGLRPLASLEELRDDPARTLLISFRGANAAGKPYPDRLDELKNIFDDGLRDFVDNGGAVLVATDQATSGLRWPKDFDVRVDGRKISAAYGAPAYQRNPSCPFVRRYREAIPDLFVPAARPGPGLDLPRLLPIVVATNKPSFLYRSRELDTIAIFSGIYVVQFDPASRRDTLDFGQAWRFRGGGRMLLLADHSVFINSMLLPAAQDNSNLDFAFSCLDWLTVVHEGQRRDRVLYINDMGEIESDFNMLLRELPPPSPEEVLDFLWQNRDKASPIVATLEDEGWFRDLEREDPFNRMLLQWNPHWVIVRLALALGALILLVYGVRRVLRSKHKFARGVPRLAVALQRFRPRAGLLEQRLHGAMNAGQYYEAARIKARELFAELNLTPALEGLPPQVEIEGGWWTRRAIERELRAIWQVAFGTEPVSVPARSWGRWQTRLKGLCDLISKGVIRFEKDKG